MGNNLVSVLSLAVVLAASSISSAQVANALSASPSNSSIDIGQYITLNATLNTTISQTANNVIYQWYNATNSSSIVAIPDANSTSYAITGVSIANLTYYVIAYYNTTSNNSTNTIAIQSNNAIVNVYPTLNITTDYYPPIINITAPHSFTVNALYDVQVTGGTGNYIYSWDTSQLSSNAVILNQSCDSISSFCEITAANVTESISGLLSVHVYDTSNGNASYARSQDYFVTANPDPPLPQDYLGRNVSQLLAIPLRIGVIVPSVGQIVYGLGLGSDVVAVTAVVNDTMPSFGVNIPGNVTNIGLNYDYYLPDYFEELSNASATYVPIDAGAFEGTLSAGLADFQAGGINAIVLGGGFDRSLSGVEEDVMLIANTTATTSNGMQIITGMNNMQNTLQSRLAGTTQTSVAMINWYGYGSMYVDGAQSFIGSEISSVNAQNIFSGYYPSPSAEQLISSDPNYIIASIFGTPYNNISTTYQSLATVPGIQDTTAWKEGHIYILGNLATNITDEPGPLAAYGTLLYAIILHPSQFGFNQTTLPNNITDQWVAQNINPNIYFQNINVPQAQPASTFISTGSYVQQPQTSVQPTTTAQPTTVAPTTTTLVTTTTTAPIIVATTSIGQVQNQTANKTLGPLYPPQPAQSTTIQQTNNSAPASRGVLSNIALSVVNFVVTIIDKIAKIFGGWHF